MELVFKNFTYKDICKNINFSISSGMITGFYSTIRLVNLLDNTNFIIENNHNLKIFNIDFNDINFNKLTIDDELKFLSKKNNIKFNSLKENFIDVLSKLDINYKDVNQSFSYLSYFEKKKIYFAIIISLDFDVLLLSNFIDSFDRHFKKKFKELINYYKNENKIIVIESHDVNFLNDYTDNMIILNKNFFISESTNKLFQNCDLLLSKNIDIPDIINITYLAYKNKNVKLFYHTDVRDIIKDIYKHV